MIQPTLGAERFVEQQLRADPDATYDAVRRAAAAAGLTIFPNMFGQVRKRVRAERLRDESAASGSAGDPFADLPEGRRFGARWPDPDPRSRRAEVDDRAAQLAARHFEDVGGTAVMAPPAPPARPKRSGAFEPLPQASPPRPAHGPAALLEDFMARVRALEAQTMRYQHALEGIRGLIGETIRELDEGDEG